MDLPTTLDEFYEVLCAFRDNDMDGDGDTTNEIPLEFCQNNWAAHIMNLANPFGIAGYSSSDSTAYLTIEDDTVVSTLDTQQYRDFLEFTNQLADEGLLDVEGFSQTNDQYYAKLKEGIVGCYLAWTPYSNMSEEMAANYVTLPVVRAYDDIEPAKTGTKNRTQATTTGFAITTACENVDRLLEWWDYLSSSVEMKYTVAYGPQGEYWDIDETGQVYQKTPDSVTDTFTVENYKYTYGMVDGSPLILSDEMIYIGEEEAFTTWYRTTMVDEVWDQIPDRRMPTRFTPSDYLEEKTFIETDLFAYVENFTANSILNGLDDAAWETHLEQLEVYSYYDWIDWYQNFYDGNFE